MLRGDPGSGKVWGSARSTCGHSKHQVLGENADGAKSKSSLSLCLCLSFGSAVIFFSNKIHFGKREK